MAGVWPSYANPKETVMTTNADLIKGRVKQAAGDLTDSDKLKREGKEDRAAGKAKEIIDEVKEKAENTVDALKDRVHDLASRDR
jgi:uncharacterized protein YjbJ (UPF0337 family)